MTSLNSLKSDSYNLIEVFYKTTDQTSKTYTKVCMSVSDIFDISANVVGCKLGNTRQVVIKSFDNSEDYKVALRAMKTFSNVSGCVQLLSKGTFCGKLAIIMDYAGENLQTHINNKKFKISEIIHLCNQILQPLSEIHRRRLVHSDLNPKNICVNEKGVVIVDIERENVHRETLYPKATYEYACPSWLLDCTTRYRDDLWSLGLVLIEAYTNEKPLKHCLNPKNRQSVINNRKDELEGLDDNLQKDLATAFLCMHEYQNLFGEENFEKLINHIFQNEGINKFYFDFMFEPKNDPEESLEEGPNKICYKLREVGFELFNSDEKNTSLKDLMKKSQKQQDYDLDLDKFVEFVESLCFECIDVEDVSAPDYRFDHFLLRLNRKK